MKTLQKSILSKEMYRFHWTTMPLLIPLMSLYMIVIHVTFIMDPLLEFGLSLEMHVANLFSCRCCMLSLFNFSHFYMYVGVLMIQRSIKTCMIDIWSKTHILIFIFIMNNCHCTCLMSCYWIMSYELLNI